MIGYHDGKHHSLAFLKYQVVVSNPGAGSQPTNKELMLNHEDALPIVIGSRMVGFGTSLRDWNLSTQIAGAIATYVKLSYQKP